MTDSTISKNIISLQENQSLDQCHANVQKTSPNAWLVRNSRYMKREERDPRLYLSQSHNDYLFPKTEKDLFGLLEVSYVLDEVIDPLVDESAKIRELNTMLVWLEDELRDKTSKLLSVWAKRGRPIEEAKYAKEAEIRKLYEKCDELRNKAKQIREQIAYARSRKSDSEEEAKRFTDEWPAPIPFEDDLLPVESFDIAMLPLPFRNYVQDCAERIGCPIEFVAVGVMVVFSSILGAGCAIRPHKIDDWAVIPNLWGAIIGNPSSKKSPALNAALLPIAELEKIAAMVFKEQKILAEGNKIEKESREKNLRKKMDEAVQNEDKNEINNIKGKLTSLSAENHSFFLQRYKTNSATIEKLQEILSFNPRGMLQFNDELMGFLASLEKEGREDSRAFYLEGWNGWASSNFQSDRISRGETQCNICISILGGIQPSKLCIYLRDLMKNIGNDGFIQRFQLLVFPDQPKEWKLIDREPDLDARQQIIDIAKKLANTNFFEFGANDESFPLPVFRFSPLAQSVFHNWLANLENRLLNEVGNELVMQHLHKFRKLVPALSLINFLVRSAGQKSVSIMSGISEEDVEIAIKFSAFLESHARRVYSMIDRSEVIAGKILLSKIQRGELRDGFRVRDVYRHGWSGISKDEAQEACDELVSRYWIKERLEPTSSAGGRPSATYWFHETLKKQLKDTDKTDKTDGKDR